MGMVIKKHDHKWMEPTKDFPSISAPDSRFVDALRKILDGVANRTTSRKLASNGKYNLTGENETMRGMSLIPAGLSFSKVVTWALHAHVNPKAFQNFQQWMRSGSDAAIRFRKEVVGKDGTIDIAEAVALFKKYRAEQGREFTDDDLMFLMVEKESYDLEELSAKEFTEMRRECRTKNQGRNTFNLPILFLYRYLGATIGTRCTWKLLAKLTAAAHEAHGTKLDIPPTADRMRKLVKGVMAKVSEFDEKITLLIYSTVRHSHIGIDHLPFQINLAGLKMIDIGDNNAAYGLFRECARMFPDSPMGHIGSAFVALSIRDMDTFEKEMRFAIAAAPADTTTGIKEVLARLDTV